MATFEELYRKLLLESAQNRTKEELALLAARNYDHSQLDCLFHPERRPVVWRFAGQEGQAPQRDGAASASPPGTGRRDTVRVTLDKDKGETRGKSGEFGLRCNTEKEIASRDAIAALEGLRAKKDLAYALVAPAFLGQFGEETSPGKLRSAFKAIGFDGMIEVAVFADILTLKEALEFDRNILGEFDYQLTSCCCPMWIAMIRKLYGQLMPHVPASVSPMIACGRTIKHLHPDALTLFVGPCVAKKAEAREPDLKGAVDYVVTFREMQEIFEAMGVDTASFEESDKEFSSRAGRIYARAGGVSEAVKATLERLNPGRRIAIRTRTADGVPACRAMLDDLLSGKGGANFFEGMGCVGGCVGGPKSIVDKDTGVANVDRYGDTAASPTPIDNPYVVDLLRRLGIKTPDDLLERSDIFTRRF